MESENSFYEKYAAKFGLKGYGDNDYGRGAPSYQPRSTPRPKYQTPSPVVDYDSHSSESYGYYGHSSDSSSHYHVSISSYSGLEPESSDHGHYGQEPLLHTHTTYEDVTVIEEVPYTDYETTYDVEYDIVPEVRSR